MDTGGEYPARITEPINYTHNTNNMLSDVGFLLDGGGGWHHWDGKSSTEFCDAVRKAIRDLESQPDKFIAMNDPGGWGSYDGLLRALYRILTEFRNHPNARVGVSS
jgi:hypothetical protein